MRSARTDSPRRIDRKGFSGEAAAAAIEERRGGYLLLGLGLECGVVVLSLEPQCKMTVLPLNSGKPRKHSDVLSMQMDSDLVIYRATLVRAFQVDTIYRVD
ncbi:hypothetical protein F511_02739 [Dorcoceras hygrometricum]|uniref:Uncharacterized protein n=1 Tax=Dorcoceras hygrometricum TaxID=472368 RepID=A0A2Z7DJW9_9LAMI|nr:hypothetical protein F511_02739 [Dorcoceras hygrometricum]